MTPYFLRAQTLIEVRRYSEAVEVLRRHLVEEADDAHAHAQLAVCLVEQESFPAATEHAQQSIALAPDAGFSHYALAYVMLQRNRFDEAHASADAAIQAEPDGIEHYRLRAAVRMQQERWTDALQDAESGLRIDPEDTGCLNTRSRCLMRLGRREDAYRSIETALHRHPDSASSHATRGWALLETGKPKEAMHHFREALRLDPSMEYAREGIVHAMKARHFLYRVFLGYIFWMMRLSPRARWGVVIGGLVGANVVSSLSESHPSWAPFLNPLLWTYIAFAILTWLSVPLFNLLLRASRYGRHALSTEQTHGANLLGVGLLAVLSLFLWALWSSSAELLDTSLFAGLLLIPTSAIFLCPAGWPRWAMVAATGGLGLLVLTRFLRLDEQDGVLMTNQIGEATSMLFLVGFVGSQFLANYLASIRLRR